MQKSRGASSTRTGTRVSFGARSFRAGRGSQGANPRDLFGLVRLGDRRGFWQDEFTYASGAVGEFGENRHLAHIAGSYWERHATVSSDESRQRDRNGFSGRYAGGLGSIKLIVASGFVDTDR